MTLYLSLLFVFAISEFLSSIRRNCFRLQVAPLTSLRILEVRMNKMLGWTDWVTFLLDPSYRVQLILTWFILDFLDKENWLSLFFSLSVSSAINPFI